MVSLEKNVKPIIESVYDNLTSIEKEIANYFLYSNLSNEDLSASAVSNKLFVSIPSLTRFAKKCGFNGYRQFIYEFGTSTNNNIYVSNDLTKKVLHTYEELLNKTYSLIDEEQLLRVCNMLDKAKRVYIYGKGSSGLVAQEMKLRFMRIGLICETITDTHMIKMNSALIDEECLVIGISVSGKTKDIIDAVQYSKSAGAKTVLITSQNNEELMSYCDELVLIALKSLLEQGTLISPQFPILVMVDIFYAFYLELDKEGKYKKFSSTLSALTKE